MDYLLSRLNSFSLDVKGLTSKNLFDKTRKKWKYVDVSDTLVVCLPGWGQELWTWGGVKKHTGKYHCSFLAYEFPRSILSDSASLTEECFKEITKQVRKDIKDLKMQYGFKRCVLVAISLASSFGSMVYKDNADIDGIILIAPGENLARDMWYGVRTQHLRKSYQSQGIQLEELERLWEPLASENNFPLSNTKVNIFYGKSDAVIPIRFSKKLQDVLKGRNHQVFSKYLQCGHYLLIWHFLLRPKKFTKGMLQ